MLTAQAKIVFFIYKRNSLRIFTNKFVKDYLEADVVLYRMVRKPWMDKKWSEYVLRDLTQKITG